MFKLNGAKPPELHGLYNRKGDVFDHFLATWNSDYFVPLSQCHYGLTITLTILTTQTDLSRTDGWSPYLIPFEALIPKEITKYMSDRGYSLNL